MKRLKKVGIFIWTVLPFITLASTKNLEIDAICYSSYMDYREKSYQARYDEGYEKGFENGAISAYHRAKAATFDILMEALDDMGVFDKDEKVKEEIKEEIKVALSSSSTLRH